MLIWLANGITAKVMKAGITHEAVVQRLLDSGFGNNFVAWQDDGEIASLRMADGVTQQYHVRIFADGEVRGHHELTPESHPLKHYKEEGMEPRQEYFRSVFGDMLEYVV